MIQTPVPTEQRATHLLAGWLGGVAMGQGAAAAVTAWDGVAAMADCLLRPEPDAEGLAQRWRVALDSPLALGALPPFGPPMSLVTFDSPANLLSASYHLGALSHGEEACWASVAVNVALARFLRGFRDFVPDVIEALRTNEAPARLLALARRLPILALDEVVAPTSGTSPASATAIASLWLAYHEPMAARGLAFAANQAVGHLPGCLPPVLALFGARDGRLADRLELDLPRSIADIRALATRLARLPQPRTEQP
jgi:hypothetical protein